MTKRSLWVVGLIVGLCVVVYCGQSFAQEAAAPAAAGAAAAGGEEAAGAGAHSMSLYNIVFKSGWFGLLVWLTLLGSSIVSLALIVDSFLTIRDEKIAPPALVESVRSAIEQGNLMEAIERCDVSLTPLGRILKAGFMNVQEGFEVVQDSVSVAADIESETLLGRVAYLSVISNVTPMLGLIGTVQGMIYAFFSLGTQEAGAAQQAMLALNISHGLWATAVGLGISVPASILFYFFKNRTMRIILGMEALTLDITKSLRNAEVVEEE